MKEGDRGGEEGKRERVYFCFVYFIITPPPFFICFFSPSFNFISLNKEKEFLKRDEKKKKKEKTPVGREEGWVGLLIINFNGLCSSLSFFSLVSLFLNFEYFVYSHRFLLKSITRGRCV